MIRNFEIDKNPKDSYNSSAELMSIATQLSDHRAYESSKIEHSTKLSIKMLLFF